jgi:hypothetical protein
MSKCARVFSLALIGVVAAVSPTASDSAGWGPEGELIAVADGVDSEGGTWICADGAGGAIIVWADDDRSGLDDDDEIYAQRIDGDGDTLWTGNGVLVCSADGNQQTPRVVSDGAGGAVIAWLDERDWENRSLYVQKLDATGDTLWAKDGVLVGEADDSPKIVSDGAGGAIVAWVDTTETDPYYGGDNFGVLNIQRITSSGTVALGWTAGGIAIDDSDIIRDFAIASDGAGGVWIAWTEYDHELRAARFSSAGANVADTLLSWGELPNYSLSIASDGADGAIVAWSEDRNIFYSDILAQKVDGAGNPQWATTGVTVCAADGDQDTPEIVTDGAGGAIVTWIDGRASGDYDVYAQRVASSGATMWTSDGVKLCSAGRIQTSARPNIVADGFGGAIVTWMDYRSGERYEAYAQRVSASGGIQYFSSGLELCSTYAYQIFPMAVTDGDGGAIISWMNATFDSQTIYAQRVVNEGILDSGGADRPYANVLYQNVPNPFTSTTRIAFTNKKPGRARLEVFDAAGRLVRVLSDGPVQTPVQVEEWDGRDDNGRPMPAGTYFYRVEAPGWVSMKKMTLAK